MTEHEPHEPIADCDCHQCAVVERNRLRQEVTMLRQEYAADTVEIDKLNAMLDEHRGEIARLKAKLAEAEKDAGRYRAVRSGAAYIEPHPGGEIYVATDRGLYCKTASEVDALIDAAIEQERSDVPTNP